MSKSTPAGESLYEVLAARLRANQPTALVVVIEGPNAGATMLVSPDAPSLGSLGNTELDRVASRDALGELEAGRTGARNYEIGRAHV